MEDTSNYKVDYDNVALEKQYSQYQEESKSSGAAELASDDFKYWLRESLQKDILRVKENGALPLELGVNNTVVLRRDKELINRIEFQTYFDFSTVEEILLSQEVVHPRDPELMYVTVVLFGKNKKVPLVFPYSYRKSVVSSAQVLGQLKKKKKKKKNTVNNELDCWVFVNSIGKEAEHKISYFNNI